MWLPQGVPGATRVQRVETDVPALILLLSILLVKNHQMRGKAEVARPYSEPPLHERNLISGLFIKGQHGEVALSIWVHQVRDVRPLKLHALVD